MDKQSKKLLLKLEKKIIVAANLVQEKTRHGLILDLVSNKNILSSVWIDLSGKCSIETEFEQAETGIMYSWNFNKVVHITVMDKIVLFWLYSKGSTYYKIDLAEGTIDPITDDEHHNLILEYKIRDF